jgi:hypothetical protein
MPLILSALLFTASLFLGMLVCLDIGRRVGVRRLARDPEGAMAGGGIVEGAVFGLLALLVAFTFSGAAARFDTRRQLIVEETNAIGTAYLRLDLLHTAAQPPLRAHFRQYVAARLEVYRQLADRAAATEALGRAVTVQTEIWTQAVAGSRLPDAHPDAAKLLPPALNAMIDITTTRAIALQTHPPTIIFAMLFSGGAGQCAAGRAWSGGWQAPQLAPHAELCGRHRIGDVCHSRPGVPTPGGGPGRGL